MLEKVERPFDNDDLVFRLVELAYNQISVAPDGILPNSTIIPLVEEWIRKNNVNISRQKNDSEPSIAALNAALAKRRKDNPKNKNDLEEQKRRQQAIMKKLDAFLEELKKEPLETIEEEEEPETPVQEMTMRHYEQNYRDGPPPRDKLNAENIDHTTAHLPQRITKLMERPWFHRIENQVRLALFPVST
jgi:Txe/YoeB family toxin of Txe-Axe toxin-antitoxin module